MLIFLCLYVQSVSTEREEFLRLVNKEVYLITNIGSHFSAPWSTIWKNLFSLYLIVYEFRYYCCELLYCEWEVNKQFEQVLHFFYFILNFCIYNSLECDCHVCAYRTFVYFHSGNALCWCLIIVSLIEFDRIACQSFYMLSANEPSGSRTLASRLSILKPNHYNLLSLTPVFVFSATAGYIWRS